VAKAPGVGQTPAPVVAAVDLNSSPGQFIVLACEDVGAAVTRALQDGSEWVVERCVDPDDALALAERDAPDVVFLEAADGADVESMSRLRSMMPNGAIVAMIPQGQVDTIVDFIRAGADHVLTLPVIPEAAQVVARKALEKPLLAREAERGRNDTAERFDMSRFGRIVGSHPTMLQLMDRADQAARSRATVLIGGETGTGKELIAAAIHHNSKRSQGPFVRLNCAALAESVLESELFGHERGAFTGAAMRRKGRFEQAHLGTLFLDEVSEIPKPVQVKLLRFLQEREFERVGGDETVRVDVRVVAASNRSLEALVEEGTFREDLFYRLNVVRLEVPPLRMRPSDIPALAEHFLRQFADENDKPDLSRFAPVALEALMAHPFPGNVRELQNLIEQAVVLCRGEAIELSDLSLAPAQEVEEPVRLMIPGVTMAELERFAILKTLEAVGGSPTRAAAILGISRRTIQYRLKEWGRSDPEAGEED